MKPVQSIISIGAFGILNISLLCSATDHSSLQLARITAGNNFAALALQYKQQGDAQGDCALRAMSGTNDDSFNDAWSIPKELYEYILSILPEGSTILELGSGWGTGELAKSYTMYSVENDAKWLNKYDTHYIYAPIVNGWYDTKILKEELPKEYDLLLVDGPLGIIGRRKFFDNIKLFNTNVSIIFDDVHRMPELDLLNKVARHLNRPKKIFSGNGKKFGVILPC